MTTADAATGRVLIFAPKQIISLICLNTANLVAKGLLLYHPSLRRNLVTPLEWVDDTDNSQWLEGLVNSHTEGHHMVHNQTCNNNMVSMGSNPTDNSLMVSNPTLNSLMGSNPTLNSPMGSNLTDNNPNMDNHHLVSSHRMANKE